MTMHHSFFKKKNCITKYSGTIIKLKSKLEAYHVQVKWNVSDA